MGVLTHLDGFRDGKRLKNRKKVRPHASSQARLCVSTLLLPSSSSSPPCRRR